MVLANFFAKFVRITAIMHNFYDIFLSFAIWNKQKMVQKTIKILFLS